VIISTGRWWCGSPRRPVRRCHQWSGPGGAAHASVAVNTWQLNSPPRPEVSAAVGDRIAELAVKYPFTAASPATMAACLNSRHPRFRRSTSYGSCCAGSARLGDRGQRVLRPPQLGQPVRQVVQRRRQVGAERVRPGRRQLPGRPRRLRRSQPARPPAAPARPACSTGCSGRHLPSKATCAVSHGAASHYQGTGTVDHVPYAVPEWDPIRTGHLGPPSTAHLG